MRPARRWGFLSSRANQISRVPRNSSRKTFRGRGRRLRISLSFHSCGFPTLSSPLAIRLPSSKLATHDAREHVGLGALWSEPHGEEEEGWIRKREFTACGASREWLHSHAYRFPLSTLTPRAARFRCVDCHGVRLWVSTFRGSLAESRSRKVPLISSLGRTSLFADGYVVSLHPSHASQRTRENSTWGVVAEWNRRRDQHYSSSALSATIRGNQLLDPLLVNGFRRYWYAREITPPRKP